MEEYIELKKEIPILSGVYKFTNTVSNKCYIGSSQNLRKRFLVITGC